MESKQRLHNYSLREFSSVFMLNCDNMQKSNYAYTYLNTQLH